LVEADTSEDFGVGTTWEDDTTLEEAEPGCRKRTEDCYSKQCVLVGSMFQHNVITKMAEWRERLCIDFEHTSTIECHTASSGPVVLLDANSFNTLLCHHITSCEEDL